MLSSFEIDEFNPVLSENLATDLHYPSHVDIRALFT